MVGIAFPPGTSSRYMKPDSKWCFFLELELATVLVVVVDLVLEAAP